MKQGHTNIIMGLDYFFPPKHVRGPHWRILIPFSVLGFTKELVLVATFFLRVFLRTSTSKDI